MTRRSSRGEVEQGGGDGGERVFASERAVECFSLVFLFLSRPLFLSTCSFDTSQTIEREKKREEEKKQRQDKRCSSCIVMDGDRRNLLPPLFSSSLFRRAYRVELLHVRDLELLLQLQLNSTFVVRGHRRVFFRRWKRVLACSKKSRIEKKE